MAKVTAMNILAYAATKHAGNESIRKHMRDTNQIALEGRTPASASYSVLSMRNDPCAGYPT